MAKSNTIRRDWLKRQIEAGLVEAKCDYHYTDDYAGDAAANFGKTGWLPARVAHQNEPYNQEGFISFPESDFNGFGRCWGDKAGEIILSFGYESFTLRVKAPTLAVAA